MARKKWDFDPIVTGSNADVRHLLKKNSRFDFNEELSGSFAELRAEAKRITMDAYWRDHADTLEEPFRGQLIAALDLFRERRAAGNGT